MSTTLADDVERALPDGDKWMTRKEAAAYVGLRPQTLAAWASRGTHDLPYYRPGGAVRYRQSDLDRWLAARRRTHS